MICSNTNARISFIHWSSRIPIACFAFCRFIYLIHLFQPLSAEVKYIFRLGCSLSFFRSPSPLPRPPFITFNVISAFRPVYIVFCKPFSLSSVYKFVCLICNFAFLYCSLTQTQIITQAIGKAFQEAYSEFLRQNGIEDPEAFQRHHYQIVLQQQENFHNELAFFSDKAQEKEVR